MAVKRKIKWLKCMAVDVQGFRQHLSMSGMYVDTMVEPI
jgi:hypothetical protein